MAPSATATPSTEGSAASTATPTNTSTTTAANSNSNPNPDPSTSTPSTTTATATANFPPPKTDRPRPHGCTTCGRGFARLEHLKRHERSHTKEKPFECPQCSRCFARRDLLLRHQQKLHKSGETTKPRGGRRESASGPSNGVTKARKGSTSSVSGAVGAAINNMRPRANTISGFNDFMAANPEAFSMQHQQGPPFNSRAMPNNLNSHGMHGLPKLNTQLGMHLGGGLQTAPPMQMGFQNPFDLEGYAHDTTINPAQLHFPNGFIQQNQGFQHFGAFSHTPMEEEDQMNGFLHPLNNSFDQSLVLGGPGPVEHAIDESSPSAISNDGHSFSDMMADGTHNMHQTTMEWQQSMTATTTMPSTTYALAPAIASFAPELNHFPGMAPNDGREHSSLNDFQLPSAPTAQSMSPINGFLGIHSQHIPLGPYSDSTSMSSSPMNGSARQSSVTSISSDTITEATRAAIVMTLSQAQGHGNAPRRYSQPAVSSPLSSSGLHRTSNPPITLPQTPNLQRYVQAYIRYFHPHLPFLHIPTLNFDNPAFNSPLHNSNPNHEGAGGCLILAMACIGALYEYEHKVASELFESSKKLMMFYLEERRRSGVSAAQNQAQGPETPLWLVQAMLLNLVYGHNCGDRQAAEVATTHCAALVSLTKAAELDKPSTDLRNDSADFDSMGAYDAEGQHSLWIRWKTEEERKRTMFAVFVLSSLLVTAYAHHPRILNSEIKLRLPCDEDLWSASSPHEWSARGGLTRANEKAVAFSDALGYLLNASHRQSETRAYLQPFGGNIPDDMSDHTLQPSTFGCAILINALHVYIWETRQRHASRQWKSQETDAMIAQVEPALKAWQSAWRSHPYHSLDRPNPFGPLGADCIPLLDCAYVRLFVDIGRTKDAIWERDFDKMADELARGVDVVQVANGNIEDLSMTNSFSSNSTQGVQPDHDVDAIGEPNPDHVEISDVTTKPATSKRERLLRSAANYAADSLEMAGNLKVTFADFNSRELPLQSAMCTFECAQVLAEWSATVQERVGGSLGILGKDHIEYDQVPSILLLDEKDFQLLTSIQRILQQADSKLSSVDNAGGVSLLDSFSNYCYGSKLLLLAASMLEKAAVWPVVTTVMSQALRSHAQHMQQRAESSALSFRSS